MKANGRKRAKCRYRCRYCGQSSTTVSLMQDHIMSRHLNYKPYSCLFCDFRSIKHIYVTQHARLRHHIVSKKKCSYFYIRDDMMDSRLKKSYYVVSLDESAVEDVPLKLQDHTYVANMETSSNVCQNSDGIQSRSRVPADNDAQKIVTVPKKKKPADSDDGIKNVYHCNHCAHLAASSKSLEIHMLTEHGMMELKCPYCDERRHLSSEMVIHWRKRHRDLTFRYHQVTSDGSVVDVGAPAAGIESVVDKYLHNSPQFNDYPSRVLDTNVPAEEADTSISELVGATAHTVPCAVVNDIIYCCETCPSSFSTPESLSLHKCTNVPQH